MTWLGDVWQNYNDTQEALSELIIQRYDSVIEDHKAMYLALGDTFKDIPCIKLFIEFSQQAHEIMKDGLKAVRTAARLDGEDFDGKIGELKSGLLKSLVEKNLFIQGIKDI